MPNGRSSLGSVDASDLYNLAAHGSRWSSLDQ